MIASEIAYLALGSNLGDPVRQLVSARAAISALAEVSVTHASSLYQSQASGSDEPQPDYVNAVVAVRTTLSSHELWRATSRIEAAHGRVRSGAQNAARTLDIDLLIFGNATIGTPDLTVPHPRMHHRDFVLRPLAEIAPDVSIPGHGRASDCLQRLAAPKLAQAQKLPPTSAWTSVWT